MSDRFEDWAVPEIKEGVPTKYNWLVQHVQNFHLGFKTDIGAFSFVNRDIPDEAVACGVPVKVIKPIPEGE